MEGLFSEVVATTNYYKNDNIVYFLYKVQASWGKRWGSMILDVSCYVSTTVHTIASVSA